MRALLVLLLAGGCGHEAGGGDGGGDAAPNLEFDFAVGGDDAGAPADLAEAPDLATPPPWFAPPAKLISLDGVNTVAAGDCDNDGRVDVVVDSSPGKNQVFAFYNRGNGVFDSASVGYLQAQHDQRRKIYLYDYSADGFLDAVIPEVGSQASFVIGGMTFEMSVGGGTGDAFALGPLDAQLGGDAVGLLTNTDVAVVYAWNGGALLNAGYVKVGIDARAAGIADFDSDGRNDLVVVRGMTADVALLHGLGNGRFDPVMTLFPVGAGPVSLAVADFTGDGKPDVATVDAAAKTVSLLAGDGKGGLAKAKAQATDAGCGDLVAADFDGDGVADLAVACPGAKSVDVLRGGAAGFAPRKALPAGQFPVGVAAGDLDGDGRIDLVVADHDAGQVLLLRNLPP